MSTFWRLDLWEQMEHVTTNSGEYPEEPLLEKGTLVLFLKIYVINLAFGFLKENLLKKDLTIDSSY